MIARQRTNGNRADYTLIQRREPDDTETVPDGTVNGTWLYLPDLLTNMVTRYAIITSMNTMMPSTSQPSKPVNNALNTSMIPSPGYASTGFSIAKRLQILNP
jgi:hypothetical protein